MFTRAATLPWIPGQASNSPALGRPIRRPRSRRGRGLGDCVRVEECLIAPCPCADGTDSSVAAGGDALALRFPFVSPPCIPAGSMGPLAIGQEYCPTLPATGTADNWDSKTGASSADVCFQALFPWVGQKTSGGGCKPVLDVKDPWPLVLTLGLGSFLAFKVFGGRR